MMQRRGASEVKHSSASFLPIGLALVATVTIGWYAKRGGPTLATEPPPRLITVQQISAGTGQPSEPLLGLEGKSGPVDAAVWISFESFLNGSKREPAKGAYQLRFSAYDEKFREWPLWLDHSGTKTYAVIPRGFPFQPKFLKLECSLGNRILATWDFPTLPEPVRRLQASDVTKRPELDYPGWKFQPQVILTSANAKANIGVEVTPLKGEPCESVYAVLLGDSFGRHDPTRGMPAFIMVPQFFLPYLDLVEFNVVRTQSTVRTAKVRVAGGRARMYGGTRLLDMNAPATVDLGNGSKLSLRSSQAGGLLASMDGPNDLLYGIESVRAEGQRVGLRRSPRNPDVRIIAQAPVDLDEVGAFDLELTYRAYRVDPPKRYVMKLDVNQQRVIRR
jgi:hypothetical protein